MKKKTIRKNLSKSLFIRGLQCKKALWLYKHYPELRKEPSERRQALFEEGIKIGKTAQKLFPNGIDVSKKAESIPHKLALTKELIRKGTPIIYEATFQFDQILVMVDILKKSKNGWDLIEVKSSTGVKRSHIHDLGIQYYVLYQSGYPINSTSICHINTKFERKKRLVYKKLFNIKDITERIKDRQENIPTELLKMRHHLPLNSPPNVKIGPYCFAPYECDFVTKCWKNVPSESIFNLTQLSTKEKFKLFHKGFQDFNHLPNSLELLNTQKIQVKTHLSKSEHIDKPFIKSFLNKLTFPVYCIDFEAFQTSIPIYPNTRPYEQVPFQFSIHKLNSLKSKPIHYEFLASPDSDPRLNFIENLVKLLPKKGCFLAYNMSFEKLILNRLSSVFPSYHSQLNSICNQFQDLIIPFQNFAYYHPTMQGSHSLKSVLEAINPSLSYSTLEISNGESAFRNYLKLKKSKSVLTRKTISNQLLEYCKLDTLSMIKILEFLYKKSN